MITPTEASVWERLGFLKGALELLASGETSITAAQWLDKYAEIYPDSGA